MKRETQQWRFTVLGTVAFVLAHTGLAWPTMSQAAEDPGIFFLQNVEDQFDQLALRPDGLAFSIGNSPDANPRQHYQGIVRRHGKGIPYLFVSRSGNRTDFSFPYSDTDDPGNLLIVRMGSRDSNGERLRSNRLLRDKSMDDTPPAAGDTTVNFLSFDGTYDWPNYGHPGGMQLIGDVLVVPLENRYGNDPHTLILFIDVSDPERPTYLSKFDPETFPYFTIGLVAITPVPVPGQDGFRYWMLVTGGDNKELRLFKSLPTDLATGTTDLKDSGLSWELLGSWTEQQIEACLGGEDWHTGRGDAHQMLNFVREKSLNGPLYLIGGRNATPLPSGADYIDLYRVNINDDGSPADCLLTFINKKHLTSYPIMGGGDSANFGAAAGVYVSPSGELIIYSTEYENDGPEGFDGNKTVRFGEWRHRAVVRSDSPTLRPTTTADSGPFFVGEGGAVTLQADGSGPLTKAWITLYDKGGDEGLGTTLSGDWLHVDYADWNNDNFDDFKDLDFDDDASSWRWFAPSGCTLRANDDDFEDDNFPGQNTRTLYGTGLVMEERDLKKVTNDDGELGMNDELTSMQFFADCDAYYSAEIRVNWDLDASGTFATVGKTIPFSAAALDGPREITVFARAEHPTDPTGLGKGIPAEVNVIVQNIPPSIDNFALYDSLGRQVGADTPVVLTGLEATARASFTDPGKPDRQTAMLDWGDGTVEASSTFSSFHDAFGGATGGLEHTHVFRTPGVLTIQLAVTDDDGGQGKKSLEVQATDPTGAVSTVVDMIDDLLAVATGPELIAALTEARNQLVGNNDGASHNGALDKLKAGDLAAALVKLQKAVEALARAETLGAGDLSKLMSLLGLTAESVARQAYLDAVAKVAPSDEGALKQLTRIEQTITTAHSLLMDGRYLEAIDLFHEATRRALDL